MQFKTLDQFSKEIVENFETVIDHKFNITFLCISNFLDTHQVYQFTGLTSKALERAKVSPFFKLFDTGHYLIYQVDGSTFRVDFEAWSTTFNMNIYPIVEDVDVSTRSFRIDKDLNTGEVEQHQTNENSLDFKRQGWNNLSLDKKRKLAKFLQLL